MYVPRKTTRETIAALPSTDAKRLLNTSKAKSIRHKLTCRGTSTTITIDEKDKEMLINFQFFFWLHIPLGRFKML